MQGARARARPSAAIDPRWTGRIARPSSYRIIFDEQNRFTSAIDGETRAVANAGTISKSGVTSSAMLYLQYIPPL